MSGWDSSDQYLPVRDHVAIGPRLGLPNPYGVCVTDRTQGARRKRTAQDLQSARQAVAF
jgi:hypothetical protein